MLTQNVIFAASIEKMIDNKISEVLIIFITSDFYKYYYGLNIASAYKAANNNVTLYYTGYAIHYLSKNWKFYDKQKLAKNLKNKKMPSYLEMLDLCLELKIKFYYCNTALEFLDLSEDIFLDEINIKSMPLYQIINQYKKEQTIFI